MGDAILERGQQQLKDVARVALLGLKRTRRGEEEEKNRGGSREGEATASERERQGEKNLDR